ncbi:MAG: hypothetical protein F6K23_04695 [Okeania sp. SIO2C9]|nr:hypothetical protein [Okeania sp. SIO2C9]NEQ72432.1 hypothetical protein [Okeania sp. SIO2C9]
MGRWGDGEMGGWGDGEIQKYLVMVEDGTFFYTELNGKVNHTTYVNT